MEKVGQQKVEPKIGDWEVKVTVWQCQARGDRIMATQRHFELHAGEQGYPKDVPGRDTISKIRRELLPLIEKIPEILSSLPPEIQAYVISKRPDLKDKVRFVDLDAEDVFSYADYILKVMGQPYRNRGGALIVTTDMLGRLRGGS